MYSTIAARASPVGKRAVVRLTDGPPDTAAKERQLFQTWTKELLKAVVELAQGEAAPGEKKSAPIHVVFFDRFEQRVMLEALARNFPPILEATPPLYDFLTQIAAFDSPIASFLDEEMRTFKNFPTHLPASAPSPLLSDIARNLARIADHFDPPPPDIVDTPWVYEQSHRPGTAKLVKDEFDAVCLADWFHERLVGWSKSLPKGRATTHIFRKTSLQYARSGEDINRLVAADARLSEGVMMTSYARETDEEMRQASNRTFHRILASLDPEVARRYGHVEATAGQLEERLKAAIAAKDWVQVAQLSADLASQQRPPAG